MQAEHFLQLNDAAEAATGISGKSDHLVTNIRELVELFSHPLQQMAFRAIVGEILRKPLEWVAAATKKARKDLPVPWWWETEFVYNAVRSIMICGYFLWRRGRSISGATNAIVAQPEDALIKWDEKRSTWVCCNKKKRHHWNIVMVSAPVCGSAGIELRSLCSSVRPDTIMLRKMETQWLIRDEYNSVPSVYTSISKDMQNQNGSMKPWMSNSTDSSVLNVWNIDQSFNALVRSRHDAMAQLNQMSEKERMDAWAAQQQSRRFLPSGADRDAPKLADAPKKHAEFIVSDGRDTKEVRALASLSDGTTLHEILRQRILYVLGTPEQIFGQNRNPNPKSATSNRLTELTIDMFYMSTARIRDAIEHAIGDASLMESSTGPHYLRFKRTLNEYQLSQVQDILKPERLLEMTAELHDIPEEFLDIDKVKERQTIGLGTDQKMPVRAEEENPQQRRKRTDAEKEIRAHKRAKEPPSKTDG